MNIETVKKYWNTQPCNVKHSSKQLNTDEYFKEVLHKRYFVEPHILNFMELEKWKGKNVLEIGCGIGSDAYMFATNGANYTGIELSNEALDITKIRFGLYDLSGNFYNLNAEDLTIFENDTFDLVYSFGVIHHTVNPELIIKEVYRILKPGGTFKLMLYAKQSWKKIMIDSGLDQFEAQPNTPIAHTYTNPEVNDMLNQFVNINILQTHIFPYKIPEYKQNLYEKEEWFKHMPDSVYNALKSELGWHLCITCNKE
jgi:SAM-dependent methyltransferase